jgi:hypothetical protein
MSIVAGPSVQARAINEVYISQIGMRTYGI